MTTSLLELAADDAAIVRFTRTSTDEISTSKEPSGAANDNNPFHEWPARDRLLANKLMEGQDAAETAMLNARALMVLADVRRWVESVEPTDGWLDHNGTDLQDAGEPFGKGFGPDMTRDMGPSPDNIKRLYESEAEPTEEGEPWNLGGSCDLMRIKTTLGIEVLALRRAGRIRFNELGHMTEFQTDAGAWLRFSETVRQPKGLRAHQQSPDPADIHRYSGAAIPRNPDTGEIGVDFIAGKSSPSGSDPGSDDVEDINHGHRRPQSSLSPIVVSHFATAERDAAQEQLDVLHKLLTGRLYEAVIGAATGERFDEIGGKRGDKRASAIGLFAVQTALAIILKTAGAPNA